MSVALAHLEERREEINDLNVFPVADGDTGDNMALTMRAVLAELERLEAESEGGDPERPEIVRAVARAAMMGARGNSGVILSQIVRGAAEELASPRGRLIDPILIAAALVERGARRLRLDPQPGRGHDAHGRARDGGGGLEEARALGAARARPGRRATPSRTPCSARCWEPRWTRPARP